MRQTIKTVMAALLIQSFLFQSSALFAQIERIEPPFWWAGMVSNELQLMVYGPDAGKMTGVVERCRCKDQSGTQCRKPELPVCGSGIVTAAEAG